MTRIADVLDQSISASPSTVWSGSSGDFAVASPADALSPAGLVADAPLLSAIALCFGTDLKGDADPLDPASIDLRGWPGDGFDIDTAAGEAPLGNKLWMLFRLPVNEDNARMAERFLTEAFQPLLTQKVLGSVSVQATPNAAQRRVDLVYTLKRTNGTTLYSGPWAGLWEGLKGQV